MALALRSKALIELNHRTAKLMSEFRDELKTTKRWSADHQRGFNSWKEHLADAEQRARGGSSDRALPKAAWDLAVAQAQRERDYWSKALLKARNQATRRFGPEIFEEAGF